MKPNQRGRWEKNVKEKRKERRVRRENLVDGKERNLEGGEKRNLEGGKDQRKRQDTILKMGNINGARSLKVGQMK